MEEVKKLPDAAVNKNSADLTQGVELLKDDNEIVKSLKLQIQD